MNDLHENVDPFLAFWTETADQNDSTRIPILLTVPGAIVSGSICSRNTYYDNLASRLASHLDESNDEWSSAATDGIRDYGDRPGSGFIHLIDATIVSGTFVSTGLTWRGRLDSVTGFSLLI